MSKLNNHHNLNLLTIKNDINTHIDAIKASINNDINSINTTFTRLISDIGTNSERTPVILRSTLFDKSPFSYPKIVSFDLISSAVFIFTPTPVHPKNWLIVLDV